MLRPFTGGGQRRYLLVLLRRRAAGPHSVRRTFPQRCILLRRKVVTTRSNPPSLARRTTPRKLSRCGTHWGEEGTGRESNPSLRATCSYQGQGAPLHHGSLGQPRQRESAALSVFNGFRRPRPFGAPPLPELSRGCGSMVQSLWRGHLDGRLKSVRSLCV